MHALRWTSVLLFLPLAACLEMSSDQARSGVGAGEEFELELECGGGPVGPIDVEFRCTEVDVDSCKELSNVVLEFADGTHEKIDDLSGHSGTFAGTGDNEGKEIVGVWVKAGNNASGDGPGYGERFDAPGDLCEADVDGEDDGDDDGYDDEDDDDGHGDEDDDDEDDYGECS
jgi:hypothetical protein